MPTILCVWCTGRQSLHMANDRLGQSYKERQQEQVLCLDYGKYLAKESLVVHLQTRHGVAKGVSGQKGDDEVKGNNPSTFLRLWT